MNKVLLGSTGMEVTPLIFGSLPLGPLQADMPLEKAGRLLRYALERGVNMIDTAALLFCLSWKWRVAPVELAS